MVLEWLLACSGKLLLSVYAHIECCTLHASIEIMGKNELILADVFVSQALCLCPLFLSLSALQDACVREMNAYLKRHF